MISTTYDISENGVQTVKDRVGEILESHHLEAKNTLDYRYLSFAASGEKGVYVVDMNLADIMNIKSLCFIPLDDYNRLMNRSASLNENEILLFTGRDVYEDKTLSVLGHTFSVKEQLETFFGDGDEHMQVYYSTYYMIVKDVDVVNEIAEKQKEAYGDDDFEKFIYYLGFDLDTGNEENIQVYKEISAAFGVDDYPDGNVTSSVASRESFYQIYGGLFFLGIFLGALFIMATVLIIYYKQISEGYDDKNRFVIMQNVGMSKSEIKHAIHSQILTVFFLPLIAAGVHIAFAFPVITKLLALLNLTNVSLFAWCTVGTMLVFAIFYAIVYALTAKVYYKIVS